MIQAVKLCCQYSRQCKKCTQMVYFLFLRIPDHKRGNNGQLKLSEMDIHPFNEDGTSHFSTCEFADDFRSKHGIEKIERTAAKPDQRGLFQHNQTDYPD